jgi:hypothetical protein
MGVIKKGGQKIDKSNNVSSQEANSSERRHQKACPVKFPTGTSKANFTGMKKN